MSTSIHSLISFDEATRPRSPVHYVLDLDLLLPSVLLFLLVVFATHTNPAMLFDHAIPPLAARLLLHTLANLHLSSGHTKACESGFDARVERGAR